MNAIDALRESSVQSKTVAISSQQTDEGLVIAVSDNAGSLETTDRKKIFERGHSSKGDQGSGLGLFISRKLAKQNDATLDVEAKSGATTFTLKFNLKQAQGVAA